ADPAVPEVLELDDGHAGLAGQALDEEGLSRADGAADEIALGQRLEIAGAPQRDVLLQPGLQRLLALVVGERAARFDEVDEAGALALHQLLLGLDQVGRVDREPVLRRPAPAVMSRPVGLAAVAPSSAVRASKAAGRSRRSSASAAPKVA